MNFGIIGYNIGIQLANMRRNIVPKPVVDYLTFSSDSAFTLGVNNATKNWDGTLYYSTDAFEWSEWDGSSAITSAYHNGGQRLYMCGEGNSKITGSNNMNSPCRWVLTGSNISCDGNIETLLDHKTVTNGGHPVMANNCYFGMFLNCASLITAPDLLATALTEYCYFLLFAGCESLREAPELPATTLTNACYGYMFRGCTSLTSPPELQATTLAVSCYQYMFDGCSSLTIVPDLPATTLANGCYQYMFSNCTSLVTVPKLPATTLTAYCYQRMFSGCTSLATLPELPATAMKDNCYVGMFNGCYNVKLSTTKTGIYQNTYRIPKSGTGTKPPQTGMFAVQYVDYMFTNTGGTFTGTPSINTTYYTSNTVV